MLRLAARVQFGGGAVHGVERFLRRLQRKAAAFEIGFEGIELVLKGHGETPLVAVGSLHLAHLPAKEYIVRMENIYLYCK
jgi:hypothetical protein